MYMTKSGGQFALASPTSNSAGLAPLSPVIYAHDCLPLPSDRQHFSWDYCLLDCLFCVVLQTAIVPNHKHIYEQFLG